MTFPSIEQLVPHRPPMLWVDAVVASHGDHVQCRLTLRDSHIFVLAGQVEPIVSIEWMAQTVAAWAGLRDRASESTPRAGYVIAVPEASFLVDSFRVGDVLELFAERTWGDDTLASFEARVERAGQLAARAQLSVYRQKPTDLAP